MITWTLAMDVCLAVLVLASLSYVYLTEKEGE